MWWLYHKIITHHNKRVWIRLGDCFCKTVVTLNKSAEFVHERRRLCLGDILLDGEDVLVAVERKRQDDLMSSVFVHMLCKMHTMCGRRPTDRSTTTTAGVAAGDEQTPLDRLDDRGPSPHPDDVGS